MITLVHLNPESAEAAAAEKTVAAGAATVSGTSQ